MKSVEAMAKSGSVIDTGEKLIMSPYVVIADKAATQILKCSAKLGLATTDRLKLIVPTKEETKPSKFANFF